MEKPMQKNKTNTTIIKKSMNKKQNKQTNKQMKDSRQRLQGEKEFL